MDIFEKYQLSFIKDDNGRPEGVSKLYPVLENVLFSFRDSLSEILKNTIEYKSLVSSNPMENNKKGMVSDNEYYKYWEQINKLDYFGSDESSLNLYNSEVALSYSGNEFCIMPIEDFIKILEEWKMFLKENYGYKFD